jgi:hypothetical protein
MLEGFNGKMTRGIPNQNFATSYSKVIQSSQSIHSYTDVHSQNELGVDLDYFELGSCGVNL